jgi:hypothetical protein
MRAINENSSFQLNPLSLKPLTYAPEDLIAREGEIGKEIYFVQPHKERIPRIQGRA